VPGAQGKGRVGFPLVGEAVDVLEVVGVAGAAELVEHAAAADGLELAGVADEHQSPLLGLGESDESVEGVGADHAALVDDERRPRGKAVRGAGAAGSVPFVEELGDRVGRDARLRCEDASGLGGRRDAERRPMVPGQVRASGAERRRLAGAGGTDDEYERVVAGDGSGRVGLEGVEASDVDGDRRGRLRVLGGDRPGEDAFLLGQDPVMREVREIGIDPDRAAVGCSVAPVVAGSRSTWVSST
jgi:hypothetical protein